MREPPDSTPLALALALAGLFCALFANAFPIIEVSLAGQGGATSWSRVPGRSSPVSSRLLGSWSLFHVRAGVRSRELGPLFRLAERVRPWAMTEVYVIGGFVAFTRLEELGPVSIGIGGGAVAATAFLTFLIDQVLDRRHVWDAIRPPTLPAGRAPTGLPPV